MLNVLKFIRWLGEKATTAVLIVAVLLGVCGAWLFLRDKVDLEVWRKDTLRLISGEQVKLREALADVHRELGDLSSRIGAEQQRLQQADKVIAGLREQESTWDRYVGDREQQRINEARLASVKRQREEIMANLGRMQQEFTRKTWTRDGLEIALGRLEVQLRSVEEKRSKLFHVIESTWNYEVGRGWLRLPLRWWIALVLGVYFVGPTLGKVALYYGVAPWVTRGRPVLLATGPIVPPALGESRVAADVTLAPGERLRVKETFLQASDEGLQRKTRFLLDWRIPLTCVATGLVELIELVNRAGTDGARRATLSNQADPHCELAIVTLPEGATLVLRPSFLAAVIHRQDQRLVIRRRWQLLRFQAWVTLQFRFFEFVGPCRLVVAGSRGIRAENLDDRDGDAVPARRTNQDATVGFTPNLEYRPARAETFWSYYRGKNPLFDDLFSGRGVFLCQQVATEGEARQARSIWSAVWGALTKVFGL